MSTRDALALALTIVVLVVAAATHPTLDLRPNRSDAEIKETSERLSQFLQNPQLKVGERQGLIRMQATLEECLRDADKMVTQVMAAFSDLDLPVRVMEFPTHALGCVNAEALFENNYFPELSDPLFRIRRVVRLLCEERIAVACNVSNVQTRPDSNATFVAMHVALPAPRSLDKEGRLVENNHSKVECQCAE